MLISQTSIRCQNHFRETVISNLVAGLWMKALCHNCHLILMLLEEFCVKCQMNCNCCNQPVLEMGNDHYHMKNMNDPL